MRTLGIVSFFESVSSFLAGLLVKSVFPKVHLMPQPMSKTPRLAPLANLLSRFKKECIHDSLQAPGQERRRTAAG